MNHFRNEKKVKQKLTLRLVYRDPAISNVISEEQLSLLFSDIIKQILSKTPFRIRCVVKYSQIYEKVADFLMYHLYNINGGGKWANLVGSFTENTCVDSSDVDFFQSIGRIYHDPNELDPRCTFSLVVHTDDDRIPPDCCWLRVFDQRSDFRFATNCKNKNGLEWFLNKGKSFGNFECNATEIDGHTHYNHKTKLDKAICYRPAGQKMPDGLTYFSSKKFSEFHSKSGLTAYKTINKLLPNWLSHGPAYTQKYFGCFAVDIANALVCFSSWPARNHLYNWPPDDMVQEIVQSGFDAVAIPSRLSQPEYNGIEWRLSFGSATEKLVKTFNMCQKHFYVALKLIVKQFIESNYLNTDFISSYIMKTLIFWTIEKTPGYIWEERNLIYCIRLCMQRLSKWVKESLCPNYFIPKYNLFRTKLDDMDKLGFRQWLLQSLERDWAILLECEAFKKVRKCWECADFREYEFLTSLKLVE